MGKGMKSVVIEASQDDASRRAAWSAMSRHIRALLKLGFDIELAAVPVSLPDQSSPTPSSGESSNGSVSASNTSANQHSEPMPERSTTRGLDSVMAEAQAQAEADNPHLTYDDPEALESRPRSKRGRSV